MKNKRLAMRNHLIWQDVAMLCEPNDIILLGVIWYVYMSSCDMIYNNTIWYDTTRYDIIQYIIWYGMLQYNMICDYLVCYDDKSINQSMLFSNILCQCCVVKLHITIWFHNCLAMWYYLTRYDIFYSDQSSMNFVWDDLIYFIVFKSTRYGSIYEFYILISLAVTYDTKVTYELHCSHVF